MVGEGGSSWTTSVDFSSHLDRMEGGRGCRAPKCHQLIPRVSLGPRQQRSGSRRSPGFQSFHRFSPLCGPHLASRWKSQPRSGSSSNLGVKKLQAWAAALQGLCTDPRASDNHDSLFSAGPPSLAGQRLATDCHRHERGMFHGALSVPTYPRRLRRPRFCLEQLEGG